MVIRPSSSQIRKVARASSLWVGQASCLFILLLLSSCSKHEPPPKVTFKGSPIVAKVGNENITYETLQITAAQNGYNLAHKDEADLALRDVVNFEMLAAEALQRGYDNDPELRRYVKSQAVQRLLRDTVDSKNQSSPVPDDKEMKAYYDKNVKEFTSPTLARGQVLALLKRSGQEQAFAKKLEDVKKAVEGKQVPFSDLVNQFSDDPGAKAFGGTTNWLVKGEINKQYPSSVIEAVFQQGELDTVTGPIEHHDWVYFVKTAERRDGKTTPFEQAKAAVAQKLQRTKRLEQYSTFVEGLKKNIGVETYPEQVSELTNADAKKPGPPMGPVQVTK